MISARHGWQREEMDRHIPVSALFQHSSSFQSLLIHVINIYWILIACLGKCYSWEYRIIFKLFLPKCGLFLMKHCGIALGSGYHNEHSINTDLSLGVTIPKQNNLKTNFANFCSHTWYLTPIHNQDASHRFLTLSICIFLVAFLSSP